VVVVSQPEVVTLLLACARTRVDPDRVDQIRALVRGPLDWTRLFRLAQQHGVVPLLYHQLSTLAPGEVPAARLAELREGMVIHAWRSLALTRELVQLLHALRTRGIAALPYKGPALAAMAYGSVTFRQFTDLDIVVPEHRLAEARAVLRARGYRDALAGLAAGVPVTRLAHYQHALVRDRDRVQVELHWAFAPRYFRFPLKFHELAVEPGPLGGVTVPAIAPPDLLVLLCVHGGRHLWSRLAWICDLAELLRARPDANWPSALDRAEALGARRLLLVGLALARELLDADLPATLETARAHDPGATRLAGVLARRLFCLDGEAAPLLAAARLHLAMRERWRDRLVYGLLGALTPSERDAPALARGLGLFRALVRPIRLIRDHGVWRPPT
jgi:hypothetical protein